MSRYVNYNANPDGNRVGDCTVRAISKVMDENWDMIYTQLFLQGMMMKNMPTANSVWGAYLKSKGFKRYVVPNECPDCYTVDDFCRDNPDGKFILALSGHVVAVVDGYYYDSWDSGTECPIFYWQRKED